MYQDNNAFGLASLTVHFAVIVVSSLYAPFNILSGSGETNRSGDPRGGPKKSILLSSDMLNDTQF